MPAFERISSGFGTLGFVGVIWIDSYSPRTQALLGLALVRRIVSTSIEMLQSGRIRTTQKTLEKHRNVRFLSSPLQNPGFPRVFRISGQFLWSSVAPMQLGAWRLRRCISRRAPPNRVVFRVALGCHRVACLRRAIIGCWVARPEALRRAWVRQAPQWPCATGS